MSNPSPLMKRFLAIAEARDFDVMDSLDADLEDWYFQLRLEGKSPDETIAILSPAPLAEDPTPAVPTDTTGAE